MYVSRATGLRVGLVLLAILASRDAAAQPAVARLAQARLDAESGHLARVGMWGGANLVAGSALMLVSPESTVRAYSLQSLIWGAVNVSIAAVGLAGASDAPPDAPSDALAAEDRLGNVLLLNLGLNTGYVLVGATLVGVASRGVEHRDLWRAHGTAVAVQGLALLVLDGVAYVGSRERQRHLIETITLAPTPGGLSLRVRL